MKAYHDFTSIVFLQSEAAGPILKLVEERRLMAAISHLREFENGDEHLRRKELALNRPWGSGDVTHRRGDYVIAANPKLQYVSLAKRF